jgi:hypothetical protein
VAVTPTALLELLRARGVEVRTDGQRIGIRPAGVLTPEERDALQRQKAEILAILQAPSTALSQATSQPLAPELLDQVSLNRILEMRLDEYVRMGSPLELHMPWSTDTVFFTPDRRHVEVLAQEGVAPERIWLASELMALLAGPPVTNEVLALLTNIKREFAGEVVEVRPVPAKAAPPGAHSLIAFRLCPDCPPDPWSLAPCP